MHLTAAKRKAHIALGKFGEDTAVRLLEIKGYQILARNFRLKSGELDIVALDGLTIVFVEVKTRRRFTGVTPAWNLSLPRCGGTAPQGNIISTFSGSLICHTAST